MQTSQTVTAIFSALVKAQAAMPAATFDKVNPAFKTKYASHAAVSHAALPALNAAGIAVLQGVAANGNVVSITTRLAHASGEWIEDTLTLTATKSDPQGVGSAITYGKRYALSAMVGVVADDDEDGNAASEKPKAKDAPKQAATVTPITKGTTLEAAPRFIDERKRDLAAELTALGFEPKGIVAFVRETLGKATATTDDEMDKLEAAVALVRARKQADKDADLAY